MVFGEVLTKFGGVENPFVEENDTGAQGDPGSARNDQYQWSRL